MKLETGFEGEALWIFFHFKAPKFMSGSFA